MYTSTLCIISMFSGFLFFHFSMLSFYFPFLYFRLFICITVCVTITFDFKPTHLYCCKHRKLCSSCSSSGLHTCFALQSHLTRKILVITPPTHPPSATFPTFTYTLINKLKITGKQCVLACVPCVKNVLLRPLSLSVYA